MKSAKIIEIIKKGKKETYDLTVKNNHNFICNNHVIHNSQYRGEILVMLFNLGKNDLIIHHGDRIAQGVVCPVYGSGRLSFIKTDQLSETERGSSGFGDSGIK